MWRAPETAQPWARGKTADEILNISTQLYSVVERLNTAPTAPPAPPANTPPAPGTFDLPDDDYISGRQVKEYARQLLNQPRQDPALDLAASGTLQIIRGMYPNEFAKYGPEIQGYLANLPKAQWTVDNLQRVVKLVRSDHIDDLIRESTEQAVANMAPTMRSIGGAGTEPVPANNSSTILGNQKVSADWRDRATKAGLTEEAIRDYCRANDMTPEAFVQMFEGRALSDAVVTHDR